MVSGDAEAELIPAVEKLIEGVQLIGDAVTTLLTYVLSVLGVQVPSLAIRIATMILIVLTLWKLGSVVSKIVMYALLFLLISLFAGFIPAVSQIFSGWGL
jgi:hypothetical protein